MHRLAVTVCCCAAALTAQSTPPAAELLEGLAHSAIIFSRTARGLSARETLTQHGRQGAMEVARDKHDQIKYIDFTVPPNFQNHQVVSEYTLAPVGDSTAIHEIRRTLFIDGLPPNALPDARHTLTLNLPSPEDETKKKLVEDLERGQLTGAVTDFGQVLLLFTAAHQPDYSFTVKRPATLDREPAFVLDYRQHSGSAAVTDFRDRAAERHLIEGRIWLRRKDLIPLRITVNTEEIVSPKYALRNEAEINYRPTVYGLAPASVTHRQYLNQDLLVENVFTYTDYSGPTPIP